MASFDLNKPATSTWTPPNVARSNADKIPGGPPSGVKMASESERKSAPSVNWNASVASNMDIPMWPNNVAMELLLLSMYGVNNLSLLANPGSISPFGLFPLGLPVPPIPMMPQSSDASRVPPTTGRVVPKTVQRPTSSSIHLAKSGNLHRALNGTVSAIDMTLSRENKVKLGDRTVPRSSLSKPSTLERSKTPNGGGSSSVHFTNSIGCTTSREKAIVMPRTTNIIPSPVPLSAVGSMNKIPSKRPVAASKKEALTWKLPVTKMPLVSVKATSSGISNIKSRGIMDTTTTSNQAHPGRNPSRIVGTYAAKTVPLPFDSHFRDAEAAAILLGLRHGLNESCRTSAPAGGSPSVRGPMQAVRVRENSNPIHGNRTQDEGFHFSQTAPAQAVDLSTKRKLKSQEAPRRSNINSKYNSIKLVHQRPVERQKQQYTKTVLPVTSKDVGTRNAPAKAGSSLAQSAPIKDGPQRRFLPPSSTSGDSTSVVSHLPSCICAFDFPSLVEGCNTICAEQSRILQGQQLPIAGFNFKKAICEKFSQASTACNSKERCINLPCVQHTYAVAESTSRAPLQPTWSISAPTNTSAVQNSVKSKELVNTTKRQSVLYAATTGSIGETLPLSTNGSPATPVIDNTARVINTLPSSGAHATARTFDGRTIRLSKTVSKSPPVQTHKLNNTSSPRLAVTACTSDITTASAVSQKSDFRQTIHSFSALRQKSVEFYNTFDCGDEPRGITGKSMMAGTSTTSVGETFKPRLPVSNLYRIRNSGLGGSNDSLHSDHSDAEPKKQDSGDDSDSSESGSDSESSGGANSDESDAESDREVSAAKNEPIEQPTVKNGVKQASASASRFVLNRPKFTLGSTEANARTTKNPDGCASKPGSPAPSPSSKVTIRRPTFTFSSSGSIASTEEAKQAETSAKIPELKCDGDEGQNSFKFKFIQALSKPDWKEGLAVDGKSLRALLGEADYFYHNNKKYVLKRYLTTAKPKEDFIANVAGSNGVVPANKNARRDAWNNNVLERGNYPRIEPRISVTARKRTELTDMMEIKAKKAKKLRKRDFSTHEKKQDFSEQDGGGKRVKLETKSSAKHSIPRNKRRRRNHEIDNLVFEGAGGLTPIPDLSLRDSDVFSNIKLRRREAAKRGITESTTEKEKSGTKSSLRTKWLKNAAHNRAIANKNRKRSIEEKLRRYQKKKRLFVTKNNVNPKPETLPLRSSCVRINAGIVRPHLDADIVAEGEVEKLGKNAITGPKEYHQDSICSVTPESKQSVHVKRKATFKCHVATADDDKKLNEKSLKRKQYLNRENCESKPKFIDQAEKKHAAGEVEEQSIGPSDNINEGRRRTSKRISERNISVDSVSNVKKCDDETTIFDSDSVRSDSPVLITTRAKKQGKRRVSAKGRASPGSTKLSSSKSTRNGTSAPRGRGFTLVSCFTTPSALTLAAAFGDLQPSYSAKVAGKLGSPNAWEVGPSALEVKQQLQREMWRNMTLGMFTNSNKLSIDNGR